MASVPRGIKGDLKVYGVKIRTVDEKAEKLLEKNRQLLLIIITLCPNEHVR